MDYNKKVEEFHKAFRRPVREEPGFESEESKALRVRLLREEVDELAEALEKDDKIGVLDALVDIQYILSGSIVEFGFQKVFDEAFEEIHQSNMSKLDANGEPILREDGKVLKSDRYRKPDLKKILK